MIGVASGLLADALDMFADASAYAIALLAVSRSHLFKRRAACAAATLRMRSASTREFRRPQPWPCGKLS